MSYKENRAFRYKCQPALIPEGQLIVPSSVLIVVQHFQSEHAHLVIASSDQLSSSHAFGYSQQVLSDMMNSQIVVATNTKTTRLVPQLAQ